MTDPDHGTPHGTSSSSIFFVLGRKKNKHAQRKQIELKVVALKQKQNSEDFFYWIHTIWEYFIQFRLSVKCTDGKCSCNHFTFVQLYIFKSNLLLCYSSKISRSLPNFIWIWSDCTNVSFVAKTDCLLGGVESHLVEILYFILTASSSLPAGCVGRAEGGSLAPRPGRTACTLILILALC